MAKLKLELQNVTYYNTETPEKTVKGNIPLYTDKTGFTVCLAVEQDSNTKEVYDLNLVDFKFKKKMYQPTEIIAKIQISLWNNSGDNKRDWISVSKDVIEDLFSNKQVSLTSVIDAKNENAIGDDYYVQDVKINYKSAAMYATLSIYSLDKLLTLHAASQAFVSKKLSEIVPSVLDGVTAPYDSQKKIAERCETMNVLREVDNGNVSEHIFPYLVQYNESAYDMLARTANRWGEFMFYEDGMLTFGYDKSQTAQTISDWEDLEYCDLDSGLKTDETDESYDAEAAYHANITDSPLPQNGDVVRNLVGCSMDNGLDVWIMKKVATFLGNTKNVPTWVGNQVFDDTYNRLLANKNSDTVNKEFDKKYFKNQTVKEKYGMHEFKDLGNRLAFNPFTELHTKYNQKYYCKILEKELKASRGAVRIDFDTTYPNLKLGQIINVNGDEFIVNDIEAKFETVLDYTVEKYTKVVVVKNTKLVFQVIALAKVDEEAFYPMMLPSGHIRFSGPQLAKVYDADDPLNQNRVRIYYPWQNLPDDPSDEEADPVSTPWLVYATSAASKSNGIFGKHYKGDEVIVNFANGNVENPYVVGGLAMKGNKVPGSLAERDIVLSSPGGHTLRMDDGSGAGATAFLAGALAPGYELVTTFFPITSGIDYLGLDEKKSKQLEGGFQLTDKYGVYTISGSTDERNVSIKSPWGDVSINAFTGISISAPNGDIEIKGKNVKIEAGNNLELVSGTNIGSSWRPHKETFPGGLAQVGTDVMAAVTKKLAEKVATLVDISILRSMFEIVVRPIEGATVVKSNRYLKLETGDDECDYPDTGYKEGHRDMALKASQDKIRAGLSLTAGVCGLIKKTKAIAADIDSDFRSRYNDCVKKHQSFKAAINNARRYANGYSTNPDVPICQTLVENTNTFWAPGEYQPLTEDDLHFLDSYKIAELADVSADAVEHYWGNGVDLTNVPVEQQKQPIIDARIKHRRKILSAANSLRKAICYMMKFDELTKLSINRKIGWNRGHNLIKNYKDVMKDAFTKGNLYDSFYYQEFTEAQKALNDELTKENTATSRHALRRLAAVNLLQGLGFQDAWRTNAAGLPAPNSEATAAGLNNNWENYADSLAAFPPLEAKELAIWKALTDPFAKAKEEINPIQVVFENKVWENSKKGSILYTYDGNTYTLGKDLNVVNNAASPEAIENDVAANLVANDGENLKVKKALKEITDALKSL